jgi:hypothetical protein
MHYSASTGGGGGNGEIIETIERCHDLTLDNVPAPMIESSSGTIGPWSLLCMQIEYGIPDFLLTEEVI